MAKKNRNRQQGNANADANTAASKPAFLTVTAKSSVTDVLWHALTSLDNIAEESHRHTQQRLLAAGTNPLKRQRDASDEPTTDATAAATLTPTSSSASLSAVYAAMARPHYETLETAVAAFGLQLLPVLHEVTRRVGLAMGTPLLSSADAWETAAMLCGYYPTGPAAKMVEELLELLVRGRGVFFFEAPCVVGEPAQPQQPAPCVLSKATVAEVRAGGLAKECDMAASSPAATSVGSDEAAQSRALLTSVTRKLSALREMLAAAGPYLPSSLLQQAAMRFTCEVVEGGMLSLERVLGGAASENRLCWRIPAVCQAPCLQMLQTLLTTQQPLAEVAACASRVVSEVTASLHRGCPVQPAAGHGTHSPSNGNADSTPNAAQQKQQPSAALDDPAFYASWPPFSLYKDVVAAAVQLRQTLSLLRHPHTIPVYTPPTVVEERVTSKVIVVDTTVRQQQQQQQVEGVTNTIAHATAAATNVMPSSSPSAATPTSAAAVSEHPALAAPPPRTRQPSPPSHPSGPRAASAKPMQPEATPTSATAAAAAAPKPYVKETLTASAPVRPTSGREEDDSESIPDIDMEDD